MINSKLTQKLTYRGQRVHLIVGVFVYLYKGRVTFEFMSSDPLPSTITTLLLNYQDMLSHTHIHGNEYAPFKWLIRDASSINRAREITGKLQTGQSVLVWSEVMFEQRFERMHLPS